MKEQILSNEAREARNQYLREYRAKNKERIKAINKRYWEKKALAKEVEHAEATREKR